MSKTNIRAAVKPIVQNSLAVRIVFRVVVGVASLSLSGAATLHAQSSPASAAPTHEQSTKPHKLSEAPGYLASGELNFLEVLPPVPVLQSPDDEADVDILRKWQQPANSQRWVLAVADATQSYSQFDSAFGSTISAASTPLLVHLLDRVEGDVGSSLVQAKQYFKRARPYQRLQLDHVCQRTQAPEDSYPSGHATYGWAVSLVLAQVAPDRAQAVLARGREFGESRIVCANQYPSDVAGAQILATAALGMIGSKPEFKRDLSCAKQEHEVTLKTRDQIDPVCKSLSNQAVNR